MLPNILTFFRIISAPILVIILMSTESKMVLAGLAILIISYLTDFLDGYLERRYNIASNLGSLLDLLADKILVSSILIYLVFYTFLVQPMIVLFQNYLFDLL